jgi:Pyruvate/2-oxoacid:ferredoxin oxidoreductase delta subunit
LHSDNACKQGGEKVEFRKKLKMLGEMMNSQGIKSVPLVKEVIDCFEIMISPAEADLLFEVGVKGQTYQRLVKNNSLPHENIEELLDGILKKGLLLKKKVDGVDQLTLAPILPGWFEVILMDGRIDDKKRQFINGLEAIIQKKVRMNVSPIRQILSLKSKIGGVKDSNYTVLASDKSQFKKSIPVDAALEVGGNEVLSTGTVNSMIESLADLTPLAVAQCFCRVWRAELGESCKFEMPQEACIIVGDLAQQVIDTGIGRKIDKTDALGIVAECQKKGAIHTSIRIQEEAKNADFAICNCCWDCCAVYGTYNKGALSALTFKSHHVAIVESSENCIDCKICMKFCPTSAVTAHGKKVEISANECIGCGQCSLKCPKKVIKMDQQDRKVILHSQKKSRARIKT